jgi:hypothetical protein
VRYGMQLLPAMAVFFALAVHYLRRLHISGVYVPAVIAIFTLLGAWAYGSVWRQTPITLREARVNATTRIAMEKQIADQLAFIPGDETIVMFTGEYSGALQRAHIPFRRVINEGNFGLWQSATRNPSAAADWIVTSEGDDVSCALANSSYKPAIVSVIHVQGKRAVTIYRTHRRRH